MGELTGIAWTDSTMNFWEGCTKVGPGCDHCYAADRDIRFHGGSHWGAGAPRRLMSQHTRNNPMRWERDAPAFLAEHGHRRRVFCSSLADIFDNEVPDEWRTEAFKTMEATPNLLWQLCTKRVSNVAKMVPFKWGARAFTDYSAGAPIMHDLNVWPANIGLLITVVTPEEVARDVLRLVELKMRFGIPWVGLSIEPMVADVADALRDLGALLRRVDWIILGGESGPDARPCDLSWISEAAAVAADLGVAVFIKQMGARPLLRGNPLRLVDKAGANPEEWPPIPDLRIRQFPAALDG